MKTLGIGVDIIENSRFKKLIKNQSFIKRIFNEIEIFNSKKNNSKINYFSKRFAAKEALMKAIGTGFRKGVNFKDIYIVNDKFGKPIIKLNNNVKKLIVLKLKIKKIQFIAIFI